MTTRSEFLARVKAGLGHGAGTVVPIDVPGVDEGLIRLTTATDTPVETFAARASASGIVVHRCAAGEIASTVQGLLVSHGIARVVLDMMDPPGAAGIAQAVARASAQLIHPREANNLDPQFDADAGITGVLAAIAETGTLVIASGASRSRGAFIIPPVHIAIVREDRIIPDMLDLWPLIGDRPPTALTLVSGPSKTADIEGILVTGVHGPGAVHVVLMAADPVR